MKTLSLVLGILTILGMLFGAIPCLGAINWLNIPLAIVGLILGILAYTKKDETPKGSAIAGIAMCGIAVIFGSIRLILGGGIV